MNESKDNGVMSQGEILRHLESLDRFISVWKGKRFLDDDLVAMLQRINAENRNYLARYYKD